MNIVSRDGLIERYPDGFSMGDGWEVTYHVSAGTRPKYRFFYDCEDYGNGSFGVEGSLKAAIAFSEGAEAALAAFAAPQEQAEHAKPVAWAVFWGIGEMRPQNKTYATREEAEKQAAQIKSNTDVRPLYDHPSRASGIAACFVFPQSQIASHVLTPRFELLLFNITSDPNRNPVMSFVVFIEFNSNHKKRYFRT